MTASFQFPRLVFYATAVSALAVIPPSASAQLSGIYRSAPGSTAIYAYQGNGIEFVQVPADVTVRFSGESPGSMLIATIHRPIIGDRAQGSNFGIVNEFPMVVTGTSTDGQRYRGDLLGTQYLFDWTFELATNGDLFWSGQVAWAGGRLEHTAIDAVRMFPISPGDYNENGVVDAADFVVWRHSLGNSGIGLAADGDGDEQVDADDHAIWQENFGQSSLRDSISSGAIPEPTSWVLLLIAVTAWFCWLRR